MVDFTSWYSVFTLFLMAEGKFYPAKCFLLILKNYGRPAAIIQGTKFSFEGFLKILGQ